MGLPVVGEGVTVGITVCVGVAVTAGVAVEPLWYAGAYNGLFTSKGWEAAKFRNLPDGACPDMTKQNGPK